MNILLLTYNYPPNTGGMETHVNELARELNKNHSVRILWFNSKYSDQVEQPEGVEVFRRPLVAENSLRDSMMVTAFKQAREINRHTKKFESDVIHGHSMGLCYGLRLTRLLGADTPIVITNHSSRFLRRHYSDSSVHDIKQRFEGSVPDAIITPSTELQETTKRITNAPVTMIPNGVDPSVFSPQTEFPAELANINLEDKFVVVAVRRFAPKNGMKYLIRSIPMTDEDVHFLFVGEGERRKDLMEWVTDQGLEDRTEFFGQVPHESVPNYYNVADISVLPSLKEAISISGIESMACGTPVIGTKVGGIPELITNGEDGLLVEPRNETDIAEGIMSLKNDPDLLENFAESARKTATERFSWTAVANRTLVVYDQVISP